MKKVKLYLYLAAMLFPAILLFMGVVIGFIWAAIKEGIEFGEELMSGLVDLSNDALTEYRDLKREECDTEPPKCDDKPQVSSEKEPWTEELKSPPKEKPLELVATPPEEEVIPQAPVVGARPPSAAYLKYKLDRERRNAQV